MADYYPILTRAVSKLAINNAQARRAVYESAHTILIGQLRQQKPQKSTPEILREQAALETAIRRVEEESASAQAHKLKGLMPNGQTPPAVLGADIADNGGDIGVRRERLIEDEPKARSTPAPPEKIDNSRIAAGNATEIMGELPQLLGGMLVGIAAIAGMAALIGLIFIRGLILVYQDVIGYPILIVVTTMMLGLFALLPWAISRRARLMSGVGFLLGLTHSALRRGL
jgi:hypothetical protein